MHSLFLLFLFQTGPDGAILGTVKDSSGAILPGATISVINTETGLKRTTRSDPSGYFEIAGLPRGEYACAATQTGFQDWKLDGITLTAGDRKRITIEMAVGNVQQQVTVEAGVELMQTEKASVETAIEERQIRELPINGRNPIDLVNLVPGMRFLGAAGLAREHTVQGLGQRDDQAGFSIDGIDSNDPSNEKGIAFPNLDTIAQFEVQTSNFSAEYGRNPLQVMMVTKSGTNQWHGTLWQFHRNFAADARNTFATTRPKLIRNQFGFTFGGPVIRNRTHFFASTEWGRTRREVLYNSLTIHPSMLEGDFSSVPRALTDPTANNAPFADRRIPPSRISVASRFFYPQILVPNAPGNRFQTVAPTPNNVTNTLARIDHQFGARHRLNGRWIRIGETDTTRGYRPEVDRVEDLVQHSGALSHNATLSTNRLLTLSFGYVQSDTRVNSSQVGKENLTAQAGIQGFPTAGREEAIGMPSVTFTGYQGFSVPTQAPGRFRREILHAKAGLSWILRNHTLGFGGEWEDRRTLAHHTSNSSRGSFTFNSQATTDGFADYLLGLLASDERNYPLKAFGMGHSPYSALYLQDYWRLHSNLTVSLGIRWDRWHEKRFVRNNGATFDPTTGKVLAGVDKQGRVDLTAQPTAPFLAEATRSLWIPATEAGVPGGLFIANSFVSPRFGVAWRPTGRENWVIRAGYGIFTSSYNGNITGSQVIGPPYWTFERQTFTRASLQRWETAFPAEPRAFIAPSVAAARYNVGPMKMHEINVSIQKALPWLKSAVTLAYLGNRGRDMITRLDYNEAAPGNYTNLQAARPYPAFSTIRLYENVGNTWYNALQAKIERRFSRGLSYAFAYTFARHIDEHGGSLTDFPTPFAPAGYDRGRSDLERRHMINSNFLYEWRWGLQVSAIYTFTSGSPLSFTVPGATLGNGFNTRPNLVADPRVTTATADRWFNPDAFAAPPRFAFGSSGLGLIDGPGAHGLDLAVMKKFRLREGMRLELRWELFNAPNHVNLGNPGTMLNTAGVGRILAAGAARQMQFGAKVVF